ncbi:Pycsar system effector family protein [Agrobacterium sp. NPDC090283]|uniref:Pycsar system effector family protein n=1 Tax=Agrobacterium sp. NPDC090283 TaxID=3363920 RepID=UPI00383BE0D9
MKNDQQEAFERALTLSLSRVVEFLKFAETKNAALLTFASASIVASVSNLNNIALADDWKIAFTFALPLFVLAALIALYSFLPKTLLNHFHKDPDQSKALLYFGDAATFAPAAYKQRVWERYYPPENESVTQNYLDDLAIQIAVNSQITKRKLVIFNIGALIIFLAILIVGTPGILNLWRLLSSLVGRL